jgi:hypothetical protein
MARRTDKTHGRLVCSFCGKRQDQARRLIAGPGVFICDECVQLCNEILAQEPPPAPVPPQADATRGSAWRATTAWWRRLVERRVENVVAHG